MRSCRVVAVLGLLLGFLVLAAPPATACSCAQQTLQAYVDGADSIGRGEVAWIAEGPKDTTVAVEFDRVWKGELGSLETVLTGASGDTCALEVDTDGQEYVFFVQGRHLGEIRAGLCSGTTQATPALERRLARLAEPAHDPVAVDPESIREPRGSGWWIVVGGGTAALAGGAVAWAVRSRRTG